MFDNFVFDDSGHCFHGCQNFDDFDNICVEEIFDERDWEARKEFGECPHTVKAVIQATPEFPAYLYCTVCGEQFDYDEG